MAGAYLAVIKRDLARAGEHHRHAVVGDFFDAIGRIIGDDDACGSCRVEVDGVNANAVAGNDFAFRHFRHDVRGDGTCVGVQQRVAIGGFGDKLHGLFGLQRNQIGQTGQRFLFDVERFPDVVGKHHFCFSCHFDSLLLVSIDSFQPPAVAAGDLRTAAVFAVETDSLMLFILSAIRGTVLRLIKP